MRDAALGTLAIVGWAPTIALALAALAGCRARAWAATVHVELLVVLGRRDAARRVCLAALRRCERRRTAIRRRLF